MLEIADERKPTVPGSPSAPASETGAPTPQHGAGHPSPARLLRTIKHYPIPLGSVALLLVSLALWLAGRGNLWALATEQMLNKRLTARRDLRVLRVVI